MWLDINHAAIPKLVPLDEMRESFEEQWGEKVDAVVFPAWGRRGLNFPSSFVTKPPLPQGVDSFPETEVNEVAEWCASNSLPLHLSLDLKMTFIDADAIHVKDSFGSGSPSACIISPGAQQGFGVLLGELAKSLSKHRAVVGGAVFPLQDIWGVGAKQGQISLTCFCMHCCRQLVTKGVDVPYILTHPQMWNLLLHDAGTGVKPADNITLATTGTDVVNLSLGQGFYARGQVKELADQGQAARIEEKLKELSENGDKLLVYTRAISRLTQDTIATYFQACRKHLGLARFGIIVPNSPYDWSTRTYFETFDTTPQLGEEIWFEPSNAVMLPENVEHRFYLSSRARYFLDAFVETVDDSLNPRVPARTSLTRERARVMLERRANLARTYGYNPLSAAVLQRNAKTLGNVVNALTPDVVDDLCRAAFPDWGQEAKPDDEAQILESLRTIMSRKST